jgi:CSLREA domain-containing protein
MSCRRLASHAAVVSLLACGLAASGHAALLVPTKTTDGADGACDADCSLREAVQAANAAPGSDVILLAPGTYRLSIAGSDDAGASGDLDVSDELIVAGDGAADTAIDGGAIDRIFQVLPGGALDVRDVTLRNGSTSGAGGAVASEADLSIERCVLSGNHSGGNGGAISSGGAGASLAVHASTIHANTAGGVGGAIAADYAVALANVTISDNEASGSGGGLYLFSHMHASVNNATIAGNTTLQSGGGAFFENTAFIGTPASVTSSILAGNTAGVAGRDCSGDMASGYDLIANGESCLGPSAANHDIVGDLLSPVDAKLGALAENGGPTPTHALLAGSPAIDAGNPAAPGSGGGACEGIDQRGTSRPGGSRCDIGAFEVTTACVAGGSTLCANHGRFRVTATWQTASASGVAQGVALTDESGYFWFFSPENVEVTVKVLNACGVNNRYWVFASGLTNVRVDLTVTDTQSGAVKTYSNPLNRTFVTITDTNAFATCP